MLKIPLLIMQNRLFQLKQSVFMILVNSYKKSKFIYRQRGIMIDKNFFLR